MNSKLKAYNGCSRKITQLKNKLKQIKRRQHTIKDKFQHEQRKLESVLNQIESTKQLRKQYTVSKHKKI